MNKIITLGFCTLCLSSMSAALVVDGGFDTTTAFVNGADNPDPNTVDSNSITSFQIGAGWAGKGRWNFTSNQATYVDSQNTSGWAISQVNSVGPSDNGTTLQLEFDFDLTDTNVLNGGDEITVRVELFGYVGTADDVNERIYDPRTAPRLDTPTGITAAYDLIGGGGEMTTFETAGIQRAGTTDAKLRTFSRGFNIANLGIAGIDDVNDLDTIGFRISFGANAGSGQSVDNVTLVAVPEPSSYAILSGLSALVWVMVARRRF